MKISVVTPVYNDVKYIEGAILSVINQHNVDIEYIIIDAGSTDGTKDIIEKYSPRLKYWVSEADSGASQALNKGFAHATGDIMCILCADERYLPGALSQVVSAFDTSDDIDFVFGESIIMDENSNELHRRIYPKMHPYDYIWYCHRLCQPDNSFWSKRVHLKTGVFDEINFPGPSNDEDWFLRLSYNIKGWVRIEHPVSLFTERPDRGTRKETSEQILKLKMRARQKWKNMHQENVYIMTIKWFLKNIYRKFLEGRLFCMCHPIDSFQYLFSLYKKKH